MLALRDELQYNSVLQQQRGLMKLCVFVVQKLYIADDCSVQWDTISTHLIQAKARAAMRELVRGGTVQSLLRVTAQR